MDLPAADRQFVPAAQAVERFAHGLTALWPAFGKDDGKCLALAVSGGPDSTALLLLAAAAFPGRIEVATVDHRLRPESAGEAADVARLCVVLGVPHRTIEVEVGEGNVQAQARHARYDALAQWMHERGLPALATAHHADDQAETLLLRLNRASGVAGLAGARERGVVPGTDLALLRPLLGWRRSELVTIVDLAGVPAAQDPSNLDDKYDRARLRKSLAVADWLDVPSIAASAAHLADADAALDWAAQREWHERVVKDGPGLTYRPAAPKAIALRVLMRIVSELDGQEPRGGGVARVFDALVRGETVSIGNLVARPALEGWTFRSSPRPRRKS
ncbi:MAG: tRNA lysidine(34) synthetase TilS [Novosphingobium sp.]|nr:tRNA lysidine(34) synthetase TilS [Novosphingobium sp.]